MAKRHIQSWWCLFRDDSVVRLLVTRLTKARGLYLKDLAKVAGCAPYQVGNYLNDKKPSITQYQLMSICLFLGIEVSAQVELTPSAAASLGALKP